MKPLPSAATLLFGSLLACSGTTTAESPVADERALGAVAALTGGVGRDVSDVATDDGDIYVADRTNGIVVASKGAAGSRRIDGPHLERYSELVAVDDAWVYAASVGTGSPRPFMVWRANKRTGAKETIFTGENGAWVGGPLAVVGDDVVLSFAPTVDVPIPDRYGLYAVPKVGGEPRFIKKERRAVHQVVLKEAHLFVLGADFLDRVDYETGAATSEYDADGEHRDFADLRLVSGPERLLWVDRSSCRVFSYGLASRETKVENLSFVAAHAAQREAGSCHLAADEQGSYLAYRSKTNDVRVFQISGAAATPMLDLPIGAFPVSGVVAPIPNSFVNSLSIDATRIVIGLTSRSGAEAPDGFYSAPR